MNLWLMATILVIAAAPIYAQRSLLLKSPTVPTGLEQAGADFVILSSLKTIPFQLACKRLETFLCRRPRYARNIEWRDGSR